MTDYQGTMATTSDHARTVWGLPLWAQPIVCAGILTVLLFIVFWDFLSRQIRWAVIEQADWGHTLVIPFIVGYFVYLNRARLTMQSLRTAWSGLILVVLGLAIYTITLFGPQAFHNHNIKGFGVWVSIAGLFLLFFGWRSMKWMWFPLLYLLLFGQSISTRPMNMITYRLQDITAIGSHFVLNLFLDVDRKGNTLFLYDSGELKPLNIAEACSGMRMLMAFLALGVAMAYTGLKRFWQQAILVILAIPTAIFVNVLRVCTLALLALIDSGFAAGDFHSFIGLVWLVPAFLIYLGLMWIIRNLVIEDQGENSASDQSNPGKADQDQGVSWLARIRFDRMTRLAFVIACVTLLLCSAGLRGAVGVLNVYLKKEPVALRASLSTIPKSLGSWKAIGEDQTYGAAIVEELGTQQYLDRVYETDGELAKKRISLHIAYYTGMIDAVPHVPDRCLVAAGFRQATLPKNIPLEINKDDWVLDSELVNLATKDPYHVVNIRNDFTGQLMTSRMPIGELQLRITEFEPEDQPGARIFGGYLFIANGRTTPTPDKIRLMAFDLSERYAYYCKLQFIYGSLNATEEEFVALVSVMLQSLLPELMLRLPDWAEVERRF